MKTAVFEVKCITNLHIGTSSNAYGVIKTEVEKDVVLDTPTLPASGIKGALRDFWRQNAKDKGKEIKIFGSEPKDEKGENEGKKGNCRFVNGQLLFQPMRVSIGNCAYCLVTTPDLIRTMLHTLSALSIESYKGLNLAGSEAEEMLKQVEEELETYKDQWTAGLICASEGNIQEVEGYVISKSKLENNSIYQWLAKIGEAVPIVVMKTKFFKTIDLPIVARNHLVDGKSENLWYEEIVPHQSLFYFIALWESDEEDIFSNFIQEISKKTVSFGGNSSIGNGYCKISHVDK